MTDRQGHLTVYGIATGAAAAIPVPVIDAWLGALARGSAMRRVALRFDVTLSRGARDALASSGMTLAVKATRADALLKRLTSWSSAPVRVSTSIEEGLTALLGGVLLEHYLSEASRPKGRIMDAREAMIIRQCMESAVEGGIAVLARAAPRGIGRALQHVGRALERGRRRTSERQPSVWSTLRSTSRPRAPTR